MLSTDVGLALLCRSTVLLADDDREVPLLTRARTHRLTPRHGMPGE